MVECKAKGEGAGVETCGNENEEVAKESEDRCKAVLRIGKCSY